MRKHRRHTDPVDSAALGYIIDDRHMHLLRRDQPFISAVMRTEFGRIALIILPIAKDDLYKQPRRLQFLIDKALKTAKNIGAESVSFTGLLPSATGFCKSTIKNIASNNDLCKKITTGHAVTGASILMNMESLLRKAGRSVNNEKIGFVGLGSIGQTILFLLLRIGYRPKKIILCDIYSKKNQLEEIGEKIFSIYDYEGDMQIVESCPFPEEAFYDAGFIIGATSVPNILDVGRLKPGTIILDDSGPFCFNEQEARKRMERKKDILFMEAGSLFLAEPIEYVHNVFSVSGANSKSAYFEYNDIHKIGGCVLSSLLLFLDKNLKPTIGMAEIDDCLAYYDYMKALGIKGANVSTYKHTTDDEYVKKFKEEWGNRLKLNDK